MGPRPAVPKRGEVYAIDPNPVAGREMRDRHPWSVLTPEPAHAHRATSPARSPNLASKSTIA